MARPFTLPKKLPSAERLNAILRYEKETGHLYWNERPETEHRAKWFNAVRAGKRAGSVHISDKNKYERVMIDDAHHFSHRIIWKMITGEDPEFIDHIDGDGSNNRFENLRDVSHSENLKNQSRYRNNTSGFTGVTYHKRDKVWIARINAGGKLVQLGSFKTKEEATAAVIGARIVLNYHPNHGRVAA